MNEDHKMNCFTDMETDRDNYLFSDIVSSSIRITHSRHIHQNCAATADAAVWNSCFDELNDGPVVTTRTDISRFNVSVNFFLKFSWLKHKRSKSSETLNTTSQQTLK